LAEWLTVDPARRIRRPAVGYHLVNVHLLDGTYELFRHFFAVPSHRDAVGEERGATIGVLGSVLGMLEGGCTHLGVATDHVIESFRNGLWPGYKTGLGIDWALKGQFEPLERCLEAMGVTVWAMVEFEADDAMAAAAALAERDERVERVLICTPDKDLAQCVVDERVVQLDRRLRTTRDAAAVMTRFGVPPASIPDYLALVGDSADGFPGLPGWGAKSAATVLARYGHLEAIPLDPKQWDVAVSRTASLVSVLREQWDLALLFRDLATLRADLPLFTDVEELRWAGITSEFAEVCGELRAPELLERAERVSEVLARR
jgi:5'-3' exonuclease